MADRVINPWGEDFARVLDVFFNRRPTSEPERFLSREDFKMVCDFKLQSVDTINRFMRLPGIDAKQADWDKAALEGARRWHDAGRPKLGQPSVN